MKVKLSAFFILALFTLQGCILYPSLTVEDPGFEIQFVDSQHRAISNLDFHYSLTRYRPGAYYHLEKYEVLKSDSKGFVKLPRKRSFELMALLPGGSHASRGHIWTWCVADDQYLPYRGEFKLDSDNKSRVVLQKLNNNFECKKGMFIGAVYISCKGSDKKDCPKQNLPNYSHLGMYEVPTDELEEFKHQRFLEINKKYRE